tara:strand:- start:22563 stop:23564 length:1002 start_codon:yes stop_codon:yes gene_type:complete
MKKKLSIYLTAVCLFAGINLNAQLYSATDSVIINNVNPNVSNWGRGFEFSPNVDIYISQIGKRVPDTIGNYVLVIWDVNNQSIVYQKNSTQDLPTQYIYEPTDSVVVLNAGTRYALTLYSDIGPYYFSTGISQLNSHLTYYYMRYCNNCFSSLSFPNQTMTSAHYGIPDFLFSLCYPIDLSTTDSLTTIIANQQGASYQWLDCDNNFAPIQGETNQSFTATSNGNYACQITYNGCVDTTACVNINNVSIYNLQLDKKTAIYPNPFTSNFNIDLSDFISVKSIIVTDVTGKQLLNYNNITTSILNINSKDWENGVYFITIKTDNNTFTNKVIKH